MRGALVEDLKRKLGIAAYRPTEGNIFDLETEESVAGFQAAVDLPATGQVDDTTGWHLIAASDEADLYLSALYFSR